MKHVKKILPFIAGTFLGMLILFPVFALNRQDSIIALADGNYMRSDFSFSVFSRVIYFNSAGYQTKEAAIAGKNGHSFGIVNIDNLLYVEFIHESSAEERVLPEDQQVSIDFPYAGKYKINANGNDGVLNIVKTEKGYYATIQFPNWGKASVENLKRLSFKGRRIYFVRSVSTKEELAKTGATSYFTQEYYGEFSTDGTLVSGQYVLRGAKYQWNAIRKKR
ncbi:MAG: hypothetical protein KAZ87_05420 [Spirochaetes bacterium]|nr:hypothetical protein [Spirochaetota bacterium]